ncbi:MAG: inosine/xanthosine triphosphatase [Chlorobi bacterium]|nr:inosine/xanthosine triphosphatase [Chlorobiota bacterium]
MLILIGSTNPVKINATKKAFARFYEGVSVKGVSVSSGVSDMPINEETTKGAFNRANELTRLNERKSLNADFFVGIEGGIGKFFGEWFSFGMMCVIDREGKRSFGSSPHFQLPPSVIKRLLNGVELGDVMDEISKTHNSKQKFGAIGFFTNGVMDREELYAAGLTAALAPFQHKNLYFYGGEKNEN